MPTEIEARLARLEAELLVLQDKEEIRALKATYSCYADGGWPQKGGTHAGPIADLFVEDGVWDASPGLPAAHGRDAIRQLFADLQVVPFALHNAVSPVILVDGDEASGHWHFIGCSELPGADARWYLGTYDERYTRTREGWRYRSMRYTAIRTAVVPGGWTVPSSDGSMAPAMDFTEHPV